MVPLVLILLVTRFPLYVTWWFLPIAVAIVTLFTAGVGFWLFTFASRFSDVREMYQVIVQTWFFLTPVVYHPSIVPPKFRFALWLNPLYYLVQTFRKPIYDGVLPSPALVGMSVALSLLVFVTGWVYLANRAERFALQS
jgi:ABC-type polysaccharide/polyol phosphate export permease